MLLMLIIIQMQSIFLKAQDSGWYPEFLKPIVDAVNEEKGFKKVLDIGTGPGKLAELLIKSDSTLQITGIDIDTAMIDKARKRLSHQNVSFQYQKLNAPLDFPDKEFDVVTFCSVLFLLDDSTKSLLMKEALFVLKPNGKIIILSPSGKKSFFSAFFEVWNFPYTRHNWTFIIWRLFTSNRGRIWQKQRWLFKFSQEKRLVYNSSLTFNNNASIEIITLK